MRTQRQGRLPAGPSNKKLRRRHGRGKNSRNDGGRRGGSRRNDNSSRRHDRGGDRPGGNDSGEPRFKRMPAPLRLCSRVLGPSCLLLRCRAFLPGCPGHLGHVLLALRRLLSLICLFLPDSAPLRLSRQVFLLRILAPVAPCGPAAASCCGPGSSSASSRASLHVAPSGSRPAVFSAHGSSGPSASGLG